MKTEKAAPPLSRKKYDIQNTEARWRWPAGPLCVFAAGLFAGVACIWHGLGFCLLLLLLFSENHRLKKLLSFAAGMALGAGFELARYTDLSGLSFWETLYGWGNSLIRYEEGRWQDMDTWLPIWLLATLLAGAVIRSVRETRLEKEGTAAERESAQEEIMESKQETEEAKTADDVRQEQEGAERKIHYIENPLPLPKKHQKRTMEFQLDLSGDQKKADDFDKVSSFVKYSFASMLLFFHFFSRHTFTSYKKFRLVFFSMFFICFFMREK